MSGNRRTEDLHTLKTRNLIIQDNSGNFPAAGAVLTVANEKGTIVPSQDLAVGSVTLDSLRITNLDAQIGKLLYISDNNGTVGFTSANDSGVRNSVFGDFIVATHINGREELSIIDGTVTVGTDLTIQGSLTASSINGTVDGSQVTGDIAGKAASITGTVDGSQVTGDIAGKATSITGTIVGSQITGSIDGSRVTGTIAGSQIMGDIAGKATSITGTIDGSQITGGIAGSQIAGVIDGSQIMGDIAGKATSITGTIVGSQITGGIDGSQITGDLQAFKVKIPNIVGGGSPYLDSTTTPGGAWIMQTSNSFAIKQDLLVTGGATVGNGLSVTNGITTDSLKVNGQNIVGGISYWDNSGNISLPSTITSTLATVTMGPTSTKNTYSISATACIGNNNSTGFTAIQLLVKWQDTSGNSGTIASLELGITGAYTNIPIQGIFSVPDPSRSYTIYTACYTPNTMLCTNSTLLVTPINVP